MDLTSDQEQLLDLTSDQEQLLDFTSDQEQLLGPQNSDLDSFVAPQDSDLNFSIAPQDSDLDSSVVPQELTEMSDNEIYKGQGLVEIYGILPNITKRIVFAIDDTFPNWSIAEHYVTQYGHQKGFMTIKIRNKIDNNGRSKKLNCDWKINLSSATGLVHITSFNDHYTEHQLSPDTNIFAPINRWFSDDCRDEIQHLVINDRCNLSTIRSLITTKYPNQLFLTRDLANIVAQLWREHSLYEYKEADPNWYIKPLIDPVSNRLCGVFWMDLGQRESIFKMRFKNLMDEYPTVSSYLQKLFSIKESWVCTYTFKIFNGEMQSTQRVEGLNHIIKTAISSSSLLLQVMDAIHQRIEREDLNQQFNLWTQKRINYNDHIILSTVYSQIVQQINKYLTPNLAIEQQKQIIQSTLYRAHIFKMWDADNLSNLQEIAYDSDFIENSYDVSQSYLLSLIKENEYSDVQEPFLMSNRDTKLAPIIHKLINKTNTNLLQIDNVQENNIQRSVDKKLRYNKSMSLAKQAVILQDGDANDNELDILLKSYIEKKTLQCEKETKERELRILRENYSSGNALAIETDNGQLISIEKVANLLNHIGKEALRKKWLKGVQENYQPKKSKEPTK
ncbi:19720_t:CDS:2, partial [Racocetra fulgida]